MWSKVPDPAKSVRQMEIKKCYVIRFLTSGRTPDVEIISFLRNHDGEDRVSRTQGCFWISEVN
jgi:hypothetical protein